MKKLVASLMLAMASIGFVENSVAQPKEVGDVSTISVEAPYGLPTDNVVDGEIVAHKAFVLKHDNNAKIPVWVAYTLTPQHSEGTIGRQNDFKHDTLIPIGERAELNDYRNSGYDKGHLANNADMAWELDVDQDSFLLSNMAPQLHAFNAGIWEELEENVRGWAFNRQHTMLVYDGPIYNKSDKTIGDDHVVVPHAFYKIVVDTQTNEVMAFIFPHQAISIKADMTPYLVSVYDVEKATGVTFPIPASKKSVASSVWPDDLSKFNSDRNAKKKAAK
jgi:endonuclease G